MMHTSGANTVAGQRSWATKAVCLALSLLLVSVYGLTRLSPDASAAGPITPLGAPTNLTPNGTSVGGNPQLTWSPVAGANFYRVTYPNQNGIGTTTLTSYSNTFSPPTELPLGTVNWTVLANNGVDGASASASFIKTQTNAPTLNCPGPKVNYPAQSPTFTWNAIPGMKSYTLLVSSGSNFPSGPNTQTYTTQSTSYTLTKGQSDGQTFYAQVSGQTAAGLNTEPSATCTYEVVWSTALSDSNDAQPTLKSPANHATVRDVLLKWAPLSGAARYEVQVSPNGDWTNNLLYDIVTDSTTWSPAKTLNNGSYYWRVRGLDNVGNASRWSDYPSTSAGDAWEFNVAPLAQPVRAFPVDNTTIANPNFRLSWKPVAGAGAYEVQVSTNSSFSGVGILQTCFTTHTDWSPYTYENPPGQFYGPAGNQGCRLNQQDQSALTGASTLYWHVRAIDNYTSTEVADPFNTTQFTQTNNPPNNGAFFSVWSSTGKFFFNSASPNLLSPGNGATVTVPTMKWSQVAGSEYYKVIVTSATYNWDNSSLSCTSTLGGASTTTYKTSALSFTPSLVPYPRITDHVQCPIKVTWTVQAVDHSKRESPLPLAPSFTWSGYSAPTSATITPAAPSPANNATVNTTPSFAWNPVTGADHYQVWWYDDPDGTVYRVLPDYNKGVNSKWENPMTEAFTPVQPLPVTVTADNPTGHGAWRIAALDATNTVFAVSAKQNLSVTPPTDVTLASFTTRTQDGTAVTCNSGCSTPSTPLISWTGNPDASYYRVFIAQDPNFTNVVRVYNTSNTNIRPVEALPDVQAGQSYYVFIQPAWDPWWTGENSVGTIRGAYNSSVLASQAWSFHKQSNAITGLKTLDPTATTLGGSTNACDDAASQNVVSDVPSFCWNDPGSPYASGDVGAMQYHIQISTTSDFSNIVDQAWVDQASYTPYVANYNFYRPNSIITPPSTQSIRDLTYPDGPIYWRVQAVDATGNGLTYSSTQAAIKLSAAVTPQSPANNATVAATPSLKWTPKPFAAKYDVEVYRNDDTAASPSNKAFGQSTDLTGVTPTNNNRLDNGTSLPTGTYAWRVRGVDADGNSASWSAWQHFTVNPAVGSPLDLLAPTNGQSFTNQGAVAFAWKPVAGAVTYKIYVSSATSNPKSNANMGNRQTVMTSYSPEIGFPASPPLSNHIYWQVEALDAQNSVLATSSVGNFIFNGTKPTAERPTAVAGSKSVTLNWTASPGGAGAILNYKITIYDTTNSPTVITSQTISAASAGSPSDASYTVTGLANGHHYYFTVTPIDANGSGTESPGSNNVTPSGAAPFSSSTNCVRQQYADLLGITNPPASSVNNWARNIDLYGQTCAWVAQQFWLSSGFHDIVPSVTRLYQAYFLRIPDYGGLNYWIGRRRAGQSLSSISAYFALSPEFKARYGSLSNYNFLQLVYNNVLNRPPDNGGFAYWLNLMNQGRIGRGSVMLLFSDSKEYKTTQNPVIKAEMLYVELLRRAPTQAEVDASSAAMPNRGGDEDNPTMQEKADLKAEIERIMATPEYKQRAR